MSADQRECGNRLDALSAQEAAAQATMAFLLRMRARGISNLDVLRALETAPRLAFTPHRYADLAGRDMALPIGCGQTMSRLAGEVVSYERFRSLALEASLRLRGLAVANAVVHWGDGAAESAEEGLFDRIFVDAALDERQLAPLLERLAAGGALVAPVRGESGVRLTRISDGEGGLAREDFGRFQAAPLLSGTSQSL